MRDGVLAEISAEAIRGNLRLIRERAGATTPLCAAVKANAYGHGLDVVLPILAEEGVERVATANLTEALDLRQRGWHRPILCLGAPLAAADEQELREKCELAVAGGIEVTVSSLHETQMLSRVAAQQGTIAHIQIKLDSGMGRMGLLVDQAVGVIVELAKQPFVRIQGIYTHFATSDEPGDQFAQTQLERFLQVRQQLQEKGFATGESEGMVADKGGSKNKNANEGKSKGVLFHAANSGAIFRMPGGCRLDMVRPGICLYGYWDGPANERPAALRPAMRVVGQLVAVRHVPANYKVGYGCTFTTQRPSVLGVVPIGYADGYRRLLSNSAMMTLSATRGQPDRSVPVVGRVSMDQTIVDLTDAGDNVCVDDRIVVIDDDPAAANSVEAIARQLGTITYEVTCLIGGRVRRVRVA